MSCFPEQMGPFNGPAGIPSASERMARMAADFGVVTETKTENVPKTTIYALYPTMALRWGSDGLEQCFLRGDTGEQVWRVVPNSPEQQAKLDAVMASYQQQTAQGSASAMCASSPVVLMNGAETPASGGVKSGLCPKCDMYFTGLLGCDEKGCPSFPRSGK